MAQRIGNFDHRPGDISIKFSALRFPIESVHEALGGFAVACYPAAFLSGPQSPCICLSSFMAQPAFASVQDIGAASAEYFHGAQDLDVNCLTLLLGSGNYCEGTCRHVRFVDTGRRAIRPMCDLGRPKATSIFLNGRGRYRNAL